jgi:hypothetical protein
LINWASADDTAGLANLVETPAEYITVTQPPVT